MMGDTIYDRLKQAGHSPAKAAEITLDAMRGDYVARMWLAACGAELDTMEDGIPASLTSGEG